MTMQVTDYRIAEYHPEGGPRPDFPAAYGLEAFVIGIGWAPIACDDCDEILLFDTAYEAQDALAHRLAMLRH